MFNLFKKKTKEVPAEPVIERPRVIMEYLWLNGEEGVGNKFYRAYKEDLDENSEYFQTKREILDGYYDSGEKIYKFEPLSIPFKIEEDKVYSYIDEDKWILLGTLKKKDMKKLARATKTELFLMANYYKKVYTNDVVTDSGDSYFGVEVTLPIGEDTAN